MVDIKHDARLHVARHFCITDEQQAHIPSRRRAPAALPPEAPTPRRGEVVYLSSSSAWIVSTLIHEWRSPRDLRIEIWLEYAGTGRFKRPDGFTSTQ